MSSSVIHVCGSFIHNISREFHLVYFVWTPYTQRPFIIRVYYYFSLFLNLFFWYFGHLRKNWKHTHNSPSQHLAKFFIHWTTLCLTLSSVHNYLKWFAFGCQKYTNTRTHTTADGLVQSLPKNIFNEIENFVRQSDDRTVKMTPFVCIFSILVKVPLSFSLLSSALHIAVLTLWPFCHADIWRAVCHPICPLTIFNIIHINKQWIRFMCCMDVLTIRFVDF